MKLLLDQNISYRVGKLLRQQNLSIFHISDEKLINKLDVEIINFAKQHQYTAILTKDDDFDAIVTLKGFPPKIIHLKVGNISNQETATIILLHLQKINAFINNNEDAILEIE